MDKFSYVQEADVYSFKWCTEATERVPAIAGLPLLPLNMRAGKDSRNRDEKVMNGNSDNVRTYIFP